MNAKVKSKKKDLTQFSRLTNNETALLSLAHGQCQIVANPD